MNDPTFSQALQIVFENLTSNIHTSLPGIIDKYDRSKHKAEVKPMIKKRFKDGSSVDLPIISNVPVLWNRTKKGSISFPLDRGDGVLILFSERSLDEYLSSGKNKTPSDNRKFSLTDGIAIPGLFSFENDSLVMSSEDAEFIFNDTKVVLKENGDINIEGGNKIIIKANGDIDLGESDLSALVKDSIITKYNSHVHTSPAGGSTGTASPTFNSATDVTQSTKAE